MPKVYDFKCPKCGHVFEDQIVFEDDPPEYKCGMCGLEHNEEVILERLMPAPHMLETIVPTYPGSKKLKAGHVHKFKNRPAEKTQIGYGGSVSVDHPTRD